MIYGTVWTLDRYNKRLWSSMDIVLAVHSSSCLHRSLDFHQEGDRERDRSIFHYPPSICPSAPTLELVVGILTIYPLSS